MTKPVTIPNTFATATTAIPLSNLDADFSTVATALNDANTYSNYAADSGTANAYVVTLTGVSTTYSAGLRIQFKAGAANTGASTLNVNGGGTKNITFQDASALSSGTIAANAIVDVMYDGTQFLLMNDPAGTVGTGDVVGPASATANAIVRFDSTTGKLVKNSVVTIADSTGDMSGVGAFTAAGNVTLGDSTTDTITLTGTVQPGVVISGSSSGDALRITQTGAGNALLVEDSANPDSSPFVVTAAGDVGIGTSSPTEKLTVAGNIKLGTSGTTWIYGPATTGRSIYSNSDSSAYIIAYGSSYGGSNDAGLQFTAGTSNIMVFNSSGNLGLGVTPSGWDTTNSVRALQLTQGAVWGYSAANMYLAANNYWNGTNRIYLSNNTAGEYRITGNVHAWMQAPSGTANTAITFTQAMTLDASGRLLAGVTTASSGARATFGSAAQASGASCADSGIFLSSTANLATGEYAPFITWSGNATNPSRARAAIGAVSTSTTTALDLVFLTRSAADASEIGTGSERARITSGGDLLVASTNSSMTTGTGIKLTAAGGGTSTPTLGLVGNSSDNGQGSYHLYSSSLSQYQFYVSYGGTIYARSTSITGLSDISEKQNIRDLETGLNAVLALQPRRFDWKNGSGANVSGFIAQEVQSVLPDLVDSYKISDEESKLGLKMGDMIPTLVKAIQEQQAIITALTARIAALEGTQP